MNLPNILTVFRVLLAFIFVGLLYHVNAVWQWYAATGVFILASITDFLDGFLARRWNLITDFGKIMDPIADKLLMLAAFYFVLPILGLPFWLFIIIAVREILVTLIRLILMKSGKVLAAEGAGKLKTIMQITTVISSLLALNFFMLLETPPFYPIQLGLSTAGCYIFTEYWFIVNRWLMGLAVLLTVYSGAQFFWNNRNLFLTRSDS